MWRTRSVSVLPQDRTDSAAGSVSQTVLAATVLLAACAALFLTAPVDADFWWSDAPRHALNGAFVRDFVAARPWHAPGQWAIEYYLRHPALTILFYPPLFYAAEAVVFAVLGVSHVAAQLTVSLFVVLLALSAYRLSRVWLPRWSAVGAALLVIGTPEAALWGRQVMLDLPAYTLVALSAACVTVYGAQRRPAALYLAVLFLLAAVYTKYNAICVAPALGLAVAVGHGRRASRDGHPWAERPVKIAMVLAVLGLVPAAALLLHFGGQDLASVAGLPDTLRLDSPACWLFYLRALPAQLGWPTAVLGAVGLVLLVKRAAAGPDRSVHGLLLGWFGGGYLFFTLIAVKEARHDLMILLPLTIAAPLVLVATLPRPAGEAAGLVLGAATLAYSLIFCPVPRVEGYQAIAAYLSGHAPPGARVLYAGYRDANLIFALAANHRTDLSVVRVDKLLVSAPAGERRRGLWQADQDAAAIGRILHDLGASYLVVQPDFWSDLPIMQRFYSVVNGPGYRTVAHFLLSGDLSPQDGRGAIDILQPTDPVTARPARLSLDMPLARRRFEGVVTP